MKKLFLALVIVCNSYGQIFPMPWGVKSDSTPPPSSGLISNTQAVISYVAPNGSACTVEVSESNTYSPVVNDVNGALFTGSNLDNREGSFSSGTSRIFVIGQRLTGLASDTSYYSRALQNSTTYYWRACGGGVGLTGSFVTTNVLTGNTHGEPPQVDEANPGQWMIPSFVESRNQTIIDPKTGVLLRRSTLLSDRSDAGYVNSSCPTSGSSSCGLFTGNGGFFPNCANKVWTSGDGKDGYFCAYQLLDKGNVIQFFIIPSTGESRRIGNNQVGLSALDNDKNVYVKDDSTGYIYRYHYSGDMTVENLNMPLDAPTLYSTVTSEQLMQQFDPSFDPLLFGCANAPVAAAGEYVLIHCGRGIQDSYAWNGVFYGGDGRTIDLSCVGPNCPRVVAAQDMMKSPVYRWCGDHEQLKVPYNNLLEFNVHSLEWANDYTGAFGTAPFTSPLASPMAANASSITITDTFHSDDIRDTYTQPILVGDIIAIGNPQIDSAPVTSITPGTGTQLILGLGTHSNPSATAIAGVPAWGACKSGLLGYWKYLLDPSGNDDTNTYMVLDHYFDNGGHVAYGANRISEGGIGWQVVYGPIIDNLNIPVNLQLTDSPLFSGKLGRGFGNITSKHPSATMDVNQTSSLQQKSFFDFTPFDGNVDLSGGSGVLSTHISGDLYLYHAGVDPLTIKQLDTVASSARRSLRDISSAALGDIIHDDSSTGFTYCITGVNGECRIGSTAGDIYVNAPNITQLYCSGGDGPNYGPPNDMCVANMSSYMNGAIQIQDAASAPLTVKSTRVLTYGLAGIKDMFFYSTLKPLPDMSWAMFNVGIEGDGNVNVWNAKIPSTVTVDSVDRSGFITGTVTATPTGGLGITTATVEFGYLENGTIANKYCTSRRESCVSVATSTIDASNPFYYKSETYTKVPCASSCTFKLPGLPLRMMYYTVKYYNVSDTFVRDGISGVVFEGTEIHN